MDPYKSTDKIGEPPLDFKLIDCKSLIRREHKIEYGQTWTSTPTRPVENVVITTKGLQDRSTNITAGTTVENKGKLILTEIFPSVQKHDI